MASLQSMQRLAEREIAKLGLAVQVRVMFSGTVTYNGKPCKVRRRTAAHAHCYPGVENYGVICVRRGLKFWRDTIKHEVAHFAPGGRSHGTGFLRALVKQGNRYAAQDLRRQGKMRCARHHWRQGQQLRSTMTNAGLVVVYQAVCGECGKTRP